MITLGSGKVNVFIELVFRRRTLVRQKRKSDDSTVEDGANGKVETASGGKVEDIPVFCNGDDIHGAVRNRRTSCNVNRGSGSQSCVIAMETFSPLPLPPPCFTVHGIFARRLASMLQVM